MTSICTAKDFVGFRDPYTGGPIQVVLVVSSLGVRYQVKGAYSLMTPYGKRSDAVAAWSRVGGVVGLRSPSEGFRCAYTGNVVTPYLDDEGHRFAGGFIPEQLRTRDELLRILNKMSGKEYRCTDPCRVDPVRESAPMARSYAPDVHEYAERAAADTLYDNGVRPATKVSLAGPRKRGRR
jgi:hypothetical protein